MQSFLVALCLAVLEKLLVKGTQEYVKFEALRAELKKNKEASEDYQKVVDSGASREERRRAEDDLLG